MNAAKNDRDNRPQSIAREAFYRAINPENGDMRKLLYIFFCSALFLVLGMAALLFILLIILQGDPTAIGQSGDFFGGFVNPTLTFFTFTGVLLTIYLQQETSKTQAKDAQDQRETARRQTFESTYFQMMTLHNELLSKLNFSTFTMNSSSGGLDRKTYYGREAIERITTTLHRDVVRQMSAASSDAQKIAAFQAVYNKKWAFISDKIGHYFRFLLNIARYIDEGDVKSKLLYVRLLRAQLSNEELRILFYNCLMPQGTKFKKLAEDLSLFENVPEYIDLDPLLVSLFDKRAFERTQL